MKDWTFRQDNPIKNWIVYVDVTEDPTGEHDELYGPFPDVSAAYAFVSGMGNPDIKTRVLPLMTPEKPNRVWEVWMEGYAATGEEETAKLMGTQAAPTFKEACIRLAKRENWGSLFVEDRLVFWFCKLFPTEAEARKAFG